MGQKHVTFRSSTEEATDGMEATATTVANHPELAILVAKIQALSKQSLHHLQQNLGPLHYVYGDEQKMKESFFSEFGQDADLTVSLAIIESDFGPTSFDLETLRQSPMVSIALCIQDVPIRFRDDSLVLIGHFDVSCKYPAAVLRLSLESDAQKLQDIFSVLTMYNKRMSFHAVTCNSFHMARDVLDCLELQEPVKMPGQMGDYITSILYKNKLPELNMPRSYIDPFSDTVKTFAKHSDLDAFCKNYAALPLMQKDFPADYLYLKILDRLFWIDWIAHTVNNDATIDPLLTKPEECSFGDPFVVESKEYY